MPELKTRQVIPKRPVTEERKRVFLETLAKTGSEYAAAYAATPWSTHKGRGLGSFAHHRKSDPEFAAAWDAAKQEAIGNLELVVQERACQPERRPVIIKGEIVAYEERWHSANMLLLRYLQRLDPENWSERYRQEVSTRREPPEQRGTVDLSSLSSDDLRSLVEILTRADVLDEEGNRVINGTAREVPTSPFPGSPNSQKETP